MDLKEGAPSNYCQGLHQHPTREKQDLNTNINPCALGIIQPAIPDPMGPQQPQWGRIALVVHSPQSTGNRKEPRNPYKQRQPEDHRRARSRPGSERKNPTDSWRNKIGIQGSDLIFLTSLSNSPPQLQFFFISPRVHDLLPPPSSLSLQIHLIYTVQ